VSAVTDAAGFGPRVAPGALATIFGSNLSGGKYSAGGFPLPTSLGGAPVSVNGTLAPLLYASPGQINFQVPAGTAAGAASLIVTYASGASAAFSFAVLPQAPAIF
jgi:uncharacterized protein (TIGR03437 family)